MSVDKKRHLALGVWHCGKWNGHLARSFFHDARGGNPCHQDSDFGNLVQSEGDRYSVIIPYAVFAVGTALLPPPNAFRKINFNPHSTIRHTRPNRLLSSCDLPPEAAAGTFSSPAAVFYLVTCL